MVPKTKFETVTKVSGASLGLCCVAMTSHADSPAEGSGLTTVGEIRLVPDMTTKQVLPW